MDNRACPWQAQCSGSFPSLFLGIGWLWVKLVWAIEWQSMMPSPSCRHSSSAGGILGMSQIAWIPANTQSKIESLHPYHHHFHKHNATVIGQYSFLYGQRPAKLEPAIEWLSMTISLGKHGAVAASCRGIAQSAQMGARNLSTVEWLHDWYNPFHRHNAMVIGQSCLANGWHWAKLVQAFEWLSMMISLHMHSAMAVSHFWTPSARIVAMHRSKVEWLFRHSHHACKPNAVANGPMHRSHGSHLGMIVSEPWSCHHRRTMGKTSCQVSGKLFRIAAEL